MSFALNQEQRMLRDGARAFLGENAPVSHLRELRDGRVADGFSRGLWSRCAEMGFAGVLVDPAHDGLGLGMVEMITIAEELGRTLTPTPFLSSAVVSTLVLSGSAPAAGSWLSRIAAGEAVVASAFDESPRHRPERNETRLTPAADGGMRLTGAKVLVLDGHVADALLVAARDGDAPDAPIAWALVDPTATGVRIERTSMVDAHNAARVSFDGVALPASACVAGDGDGLLGQALDAGRLAAAAMLVGAGDEAFTRTMRYLKERKQFGRYIGEFQALQHRAAVLYCDLELARAAVMRAARAVDGARAAGAGQRTSGWPSSVGAAVSVAKAKACQAGGLAVQEGVQMHGGIGMTDAYEIGFFMKRVRVLQELWGDASYHEDRLARLAGY